MSTLNAFQNGLSKQTAETITEKKTLPAETITEKKTVPEVPSPASATMVNWLPETSLYLYPPFFFN